MLLKKEPGPEINAKCDEKTALHIALCKERSTEIVQCLINAGANLELPRFDGRNALHIAIVEDRGDTVELLLRNGAHTRDKEASLTAWEVEYTEEKLNAMSAFGFMEMESAAFLPIFPPTKRVPDRPAI